MAGAEETGTQRSQKMGQGAMGIEILGRRQVTPRWENDPVWLHGGIRWESGQGRLWHPPPRVKSGVGRIRAEQAKNNGVAI